MSALTDKIRSKYPGVYDDMPDPVLEQKVLAKYPGVYDDLASSSPAAPKSNTYKPGGLQDVANFLAPFMSKYVSTASVGMNQYNKDAKGNVTSQQQALYMNKKLMDRAMAETDPKKKAELMAIATQEGEALAGNAKQSRDNIRDISQVSNKEMSMGNAELSTRLGGAAALETGTMLVPGVKGIPKPAVGESVMGRLAKAGVQGAAQGTLQGAASAASSSENIPDALKKIVGGTTTGAVVGSAFEGASMGVGGIKTKILGNEKSATKTIRRILRVPNSAEAEYKRNFGGRTVAEDIYKNDSKKISGMNAEEMTQYFEQKRTEAGNKLGTMLQKSNTTIPKKNIMDKVKETFTSLNPRKGNVGTGPARLELKKLYADLIKNPDDLTPEQANNIIKQIQSIADGLGAYNKPGSVDANGKMIGEVASELSNDLEKAIPGFKDAKRESRLYTIAAEAVSNTEGSTAKKVSTSALYKLLQTNPTIALMLMGGLGVGAGTGSLPAGLAAAGMVAGVSSGREKYISPEVQSTIANYGPALNRMISSGTRVPANIARYLATKNAATNASQ